VVASIQREPADTRLKQAFVALYSGDPDKTLRLMAEYLKQHPADINGLVLAARAHFAREEYAAAYDRLQKALAVDARNVDALYFLGIVSSHLATREFDRLYALAPNGARVHQLMAQSLKIREKTAEAAAEYELALRLDPTLVEALLDLAEIRRQDSDCEAAIALYRRVQAITSTFEAAYGLGACLAAQNDHTAAIEQFREALKLDAQSAVANFGLGSSLLQTGNADAAIRPLERAVRLEPRMRQAYYLLGRAYAAIGLEVQSKQAFARAEALAQAERIPR
jgi:tetratricopeptide (TPR) repeat protein